MLKEDLFNLALEVSKHNHELAIPPVQVGEYYKFKIASCTFSADRVLIKLRIPLKEQNVDWEIHEMVNTPFLFVNEVCKIRHSPTYVASNRHQVVAIQGTQLNLCEPHEGICYVSQFPMSPTVGELCAERLNCGASVSDLNEVCTFECLERKGTNVYVTQLDFPTFVLTNVPKGTSIECEIESQIETKSTPIHPSRLH